MRFRSFLWGKMLILVLIVWSASFVMGKVTVTVTFGTFTAKGIRCDWMSECDFKFIICVDNTFSGNRTSPCAFADRSTERMGPSPIHMSKQLSPIIFQMEMWEHIRLKVRVLDHDDFSADDEIDFLSTTYKGPLGSRFDTVMSQKTRMAVSFISACSIFYHGPNCKILCVPQNNIFNGHYACDAATGAKMCLPGWGGLSCNESLTNRLKRSLNLCFYTNT